jgi:hypothetical protein
MFNKKSITRDADYSVVKVDKDRVFLIDLNLGNKSITNDAENVYKEIINIFPNHRIIYRDTMGRWDEISLDESVSSDDHIYCGFINYNEYVPNEEEFENFPISHFLR